MAKITEKFSNLLKLYKTTKIKYPHLKPISVAQWILESGRGKSELAQRYNNFSGIKYRTELRDYARRVRVKVKDGSHYYAHFFDLESFIAGYWANLARKPYQGWQKAAKTPADFIRFIGPIWADDPEYVQKVLTLLPEAEQRLGLFSAKPKSVTNLANEALQERLLALFNEEQFIRRLRQTMFGHAFGDLLADEALAAILSQNKSSPAVACCDGDEDVEAEPRPGPRSSRPVKPASRYIPSPNWSSRNGVRIDHIVIHYTVSTTLESVIAQFQKRTGKRRSAHYIIGRDGRLVQMVRDTRKAWHANGKNSRSIGIEHVAMPGQQIAKAQEKTSIALLRWLMAEYHIPKANIIPHRCVPRNTRCCGDLFAKYKTGGDPYSCRVQRDALQAWLSDHGIE